MATRSAMNREIRGFAIVWTGITLIIGVATFFGIYLTYDAGSDGLLNQGISIPVATEPSDTQGAALASTNTATGVPTQSIPTATETDTPTSEISTDEPPTDEPVSVAQAVDEVDGSDEEQQESAEEVFEQQAVEEQTIAPTPLPINDTDFQVGIQIQPAFSPEVHEIWLNDLEGLGLKWIKQQVRWEDIETAPGEYNWAELDLTLPMASERGAKVLLSVVTAPEWSRPEGVDLEEVGPPADYADFANFLVTMLERYPGMIHAIEVWNEQNIAREWTTTRGLSAADYVALLREANQAIKDTDPGVIVISGALSPTGVSDGINAIDDFQYMDQMIAAGLLNYTDCVGAHHNGYNISPSVTWDNVPPDPDANFRGPFDNPHHSWSFRSTLQTYATKVAVAGGDQRLCVTEFGWPSVEDMDGYPAGFEFALDNTLEEQAEWTVEALDNMEEWGIVWIATIWNLNYGPQVGWSTESDNTPYSFIGPEWVKRPVYEAVRQWVAERDN